ncbi:putative Transposon, En/Spm-like protein [Cocos nucifera]|uniref:Putative Transposon, En/Spm-like protein n=1 Tax=Cocos nucifera TaxID=13894 RepID=A0A8K0I9P3_COCNU|nr:putative Transposon, En/Spm-like protein [Cocos nucifera]
MKPGIWEKLIDDYWTTEKWLEKSEAGYANRMTKEGSITKHSCGSISIMAHKKRMSVDARV